jgi:protein-disulfide isomerase
MLDHHRFESGARRHAPHAMCRLTGTGRKRLGLIRGFEVFLAAIRPFMIVARSGIFTHNNQVSDEMNYPMQLVRVVRGVCLFAAAGASLAPAVCTAESTPTGAAIDQNTSQAILQELREIRRVLEKIEHQGEARTAPRPDIPKTASIKIDKRPTVLGAADAPVTVVEFTDYQCPFCRRFVQTTFPALKRDYIDTGKLRWIVRDMPLGFHQNAHQAAEAAHCAGDQGKYWEMRDTLFQNNSKLGAEQLPGYAREIGLDIDAFSACLASNRHQAQIDQSSQEAVRVGITGTPSFIIGTSDGDTVSGRLVIGAQAPAVFSGEIQRLLDQDAAKKNPAGKKPAG